MVAVLPGTSSLEASCTVANFTTELFELAEAVDMEEDATLEQYVTEILEPAGGTTLTLGQTPVAGSVSIRGLEADTDFTVTGTTVTLTEATTAETVTVSYRVLVTGGSKMVIDNKSSAVGTAYFKYPVNEYAA